MRRRNVVFISLIAMLLLVGFTTPVAAGGVRVGVAYDSPLGDLSFNDMTHAGVVAAEADFPIKVREQNPFTFAGEFIGYDRVVRRLARKADLVVAVGGVNYGDPVATVAEAKPDVDFAILDGFIDLPNVASVWFAANQGSFLAGAAAAMTSETGTIGFIGGVDIPVVQDFEVGYLAGVHHVNPDAEVLVDYVSRLPDFSGFGDPEKAYEIATDMYEVGADVVFHAAGGSGIGLFEAARDFSATNDHVWTIGVDSDQYLTVGPDLQPHILTSMMKRLDVAVYDLIEAEVNGTFAGGFHYYDLAANGVGLATSGGYLDDIADELEVLRQQIIDGTIIVPTVF